MSETPFPPESAFWLWFSQNEKKLFYFELQDESLIDEGIEMIQTIHGDLVFEIGPEIDGVREFIISANGVREAFHRVIEIVRDAPSYENWRFVPLRPRISDPDLKIELNKTVLELENLYFESEIEEGLIDLTIYIAGYEADDENEDDFFQAVFLLLDSLVGEYDVEMKIGAIDILPLKDATNPHAIRPIKHLPKVIDGMNAKVN